MIIKWDMLYVTTKWGPPKICSYYQWVIFLQTYTLGNHTHIRHTSDPQMTLGNAKILSTEDAEDLRKQLEQLCPAAHDVLIEERSFYLAQQVGPPVAIGFIPHGKNTHTPSGGGCGGAGQH